MTSDPPRPLQLVRYPDPRLRQVCEPVTAFDSALCDLIDRMLALMKQSNGIGLAGPQVGVMRRLFVCNYSGEAGNDLVVINPALSDLVESVRADEGCLSIPEVTVAVARARQARLRAQDVHGAWFDMPVEDLLARVCQHENDHLNGRLILDYMDDTARLANRRALKHLEDRFQR